MPSVSITRRRCKDRLRTIGPEASKDHIEIGEIHQAVAIGVQTTALAELRKNQIQICQVDLTIAVQVCLAGERWRVCKQNIADGDAVIPVPAQVRESVAIKAPPRGERTPAAGRFQILDLRHVERLVPDGEFVDAALETPEEAKAIIRSTNQNIIIAVVQLGEIRRDFGVKAAIQIEPHCLTVECE